MVEKASPESDVAEVDQEAVAPPWMTILHNCDCHTFEQVVKQLQKAIGCSEAKGWELAWQVHNTGKAVVRVGAGMRGVRVGSVRDSTRAVLPRLQARATARPGRTAALGPPPGLAQGFAGGPAHLRL